MLALLTGLVAGGPAQALAQGAETAFTPPKTSPSKTSAAKARAAQLTERGERLYLAENFEAALANYQEAYLTVPAPELLFNLGQCHRQLDHHSEAAFFFRTYLRQRPNVAHRQTVEELVLESRRKLLAAGGEAHELKPEDMLKRGAPVITPVNSTRDDSDRWLSQRQRRWAWAVAGIVVVGGSVALATTVRGGDDGGGSTTNGTLGVVDWR